MTSHLDSSTPSTSWMQDNLALLGDRPLRALCMPGSHDAGMNIIMGKTLGAFECNVLTQSLPVSGQLQAGSRYFDVRPVISGGQFYTGHYSLIASISWQGANGQSIQDIVNEINDYTASNKELIILNLSHDLNTDLGNASYAPFTQDDWNRLFQQLMGLNHLFVASNPESVDLTTLTLRQFIGENQAAVVVIFQPSNGTLQLGDYAQRGFYTYSQLAAYNAYSDTNDLNQMASDQLRKLQQQRPTPDAGYFLLSWTLTQSASQASTCMINVFASSILQLANEANQQLQARLLPNCTSQTYPNILFIDNLNSSDITSLVMTVNRQALST